MPSGRVAARALRGALRSLTARCLAVLAASALALLAMILAIGRAGDAVFDSAFPTIDTVLASEDDLVADRFDALATRDLESCLLLVFDGYGTRLYASSDEAARSISARDLAVMSDYADGTFYEVFRERGPQGVRHRVVLSSYDGEERVAEAYCVLDEDLRIVEGDLFPGRDSLTEREFGLVQGLYDARASVSRLDYENADGEARTLVLVAPLVSEGSYDRVTAEVGRLWLLAVPGTVAIVAVAAALVARQVAAAARPLDRAILAHRAAGEGGAVIEPADSAGVATELVPIYEDFADLMVRLAEAREDGQRMVADVSHDLKTPLTVIRGYAQAFCDGCVPPERERAYHAAMRDKAIAASELLDALTDYAHMGHPDFRPRLEPRDVGALVMEAYREALPLADQAGCELRAEDLSDGAAVALVDAALLRRALLNLVGNAFAHNEAGTRVLLSCRLDGATRLPGGGRGVVVSVADSGKGFSPEVAARAFEPFVTENVARTPGRGTGLGLTMARRAAELMGGRLEISPAPRGPWSTELVLTLPVAVPQEGGRP